MNSKPSLKVENFSHESRKKRQNFRGEIRKQHVNQSRKKFRDSTILQLKKEDFNRLTHEIHQCPFNSSNYEALKEATIDQNMAQLFDETKIDEMVEPMSKLYERIRQNHKHQQNWVVIKNLGLLLFCIDASMRRELQSIRNEDFLGLLKTIIREGLDSSLTTQVLRVTQCCLTCNWVKEFMIKNGVLEDLTKMVIRFNWLESHNEERQKATWAVLDSCFHQKFEWLTINELKQAIQIIKLMLSQQNWLEVVDSQHQSETLERLLEVIGSIREVFSEEYIPLSFKQISQLVIQSASERPAVQPVTFSRVFKALFTLSMEKEEDKAESGQTLRFFTEHFNCLEKYCEVALESNRQEGDSRQFWQDYCSLLYTLRSFTAGAWKQSDAFLEALVEKGSGLIQQEKIARQSLVRLSILNLLLRQQKADFDIQELLSQLDCFLEQDSSLRILLLDTIREISQNVPEMQRSDIQDRLQAIQSRYLRSMPDNHEAITGALMFEKQELAPYFEKQIREVRQSLRASFLLFKRPFEIDEEKDQKQRQQQAEQYLQSLKKRTEDELCLEETQ